MVFLLFVLACSPTQPAGGTDSGAATGGGAGSGDGSGSGDDSGTGDGTGGDDSGTGGDSGTGSDGDSGEPSEPPSVVINELMPANEGSLEHASLPEPDWLELHNTGDEAVDLGGMWMSDDYDNKNKHVLPDGLTLEAGGHLLLYATDADELSDDELAFRLSASGEGVGLFMDDGTPVDWVVYPQLSGDEAHARVSDGADEWAQMPVGTPGSANAIVSIEVVEVLEAGSPWMYNDQGVDLGTEWREADYDHSAWSEGAAPLGYGDSRETTTVSYGSNSSDKNPTTYFRKWTTVSGTPSQAEIQLLVDDAAIVWINGEEAFRDNLADGDIAYDDYAVDAISSEDEYDYESFDVDVSLFKDGSNIIAVEVHQATSTSSDLGFDLSLSVTTLTTE